MAEYSEVISKIWTHMWIYAVYLGILAVALLVLAIVGLTKDLLAKWLSLVMIVVSVFSLIYIIYPMVSFKYDIDHETFETYEGEFYYKHTNSEDVVRMKGEGKVHVRSYVWFDISNGDNYGQILYGKYSRWVIDIRIIDREE